MPPDILDVLASGVFPEPTFHCLVRPSVDHHEVFSTCQLFLFHFTSPTSPCLLSCWLSLATFKSPLENARIVAPVVRLGGGLLCFSHSYLRCARPLYHSSHPRLRLSHYTYNFNSHRAETQPKTPPSPEALPSPPASFEPPTSDSPPIDQVTDLGLPHPLRTSRIGSDKLDKDRTVSDTHTG